MRAELFLGYDGCRCLFAVFFLYRLIKTFIVMTINFICLVQVRLRTEVLRSSSSTRPGFELMTSRLWQYISCHWDACSNHLAISDFTKKTVFFLYRLIKKFIVMTTNFICLVQVRLRTEVLRTPSSSRPGLTLMTSRSWQYISYHWDACSNHSAISDFGLFPLHFYQCHDWPHF